MHHSRAYGDVAAGGAQVAVVAAERLGEDFLLVAFEECRKRRGAFGDKRRAARDVGLERGRQVVGVDGDVGRGEAGVLDAVLEFAHVAWPVVAHEHVYGGRAESRDVLAVLEVHLFDKVVGEQKDVGLSLRKVGQVYLEYVEAVVEVFAEKALLHEGLEVLAGACDDADVGTLLDVAPEPLEGAPLHELQEPRLACGGEFRDFI